MIKSKIMIVVFDIYEKRPPAIAEGVFELSGLWIVCAVGLATVLFKLFSQSIGGERLDQVIGNAGLNRF